MKALIGRKVGMTQLLHEDGEAVPVTVIQAGPCPVVQIKNTDKDGYEAVQLGLGTHKRINKPMAGHAKAAKAAPRYLREFRMAAVEDELKVGDIMDVAVFEAGDKVRIQSISKGKGFAGNVKRNNFNTGPKTHGSQNYRKPGSIGSMYPQKIFKGKRMAGRMGHDQVTLKNVVVELIDNERGLIAVRGAVPGPRKAIVMIEGV